MPSLPPLSVGMPVHNGARWIEEAIDSVLTQGFHEFELIVSDNASSDRTEAIVRQIAARDARVRYVRQPEDIGPYRNHDEVLRLATGRYFKWASCSDICLEGFLERCVGVLEARPDVVLVYPKTRLLVDESGKCWDYEDRLHLDVDGPARRFRNYLGRVRLNSPFHGVIRRTALEGTALNLPVYGSDISLVAELTLRGKLVELPERLFVRRFTPETTDLLRSHDVATGSDTALRRRVSRRDRAWLHLRKLSIPARAPITLSEKVRVYAYLLRRLSVIPRAAARGVARALGRFM